MITFPSCYFPTKLLIIDDDQDLLKTTQLFFEDEYKTIGTSDFKEANKIIIDDKNWVSGLLEVSRNFDQEESSKFSVTVDIPLLHKQIYNPDRFNHIAILIIDYDMPDMNGLDFIKSLGDNQLKIIMLTGKASQNTVIKAFNDMKINRYVSKGDSDYLQLIHKYVKELHQEFFSDFSKFMLDSLKSETKIFDNHAFQRLLNQIIYENNIMEYYLLDESGSFLLLDSTAENQFWLIIKSKEDMRLFYELAVEDPDTPAYVIKKLRDKEVFTHFKTEEESNLGAKYWNLIDCKPLDEEKKFYYAILKNDDYLKIDLSKIKSYSDFINEGE